MPLWGFHSSMEHEEFTFHIYLSHADDVTEYLAICNERPECRYASFDKDEAIRGARQLVHENNRQHTVVRRT